MREYRFFYKLCLINRRRALAGLPIAALLATAPGCPATPALPSTSAGGSTVTTAASPLPTVIQGGARAIRIIFKQTYPAGSFDASPGNGTPAALGSGQQATRYFNPDGSLLAGVGSGSNTWLSNFEIGISGANNTAAPAANCAKFADATEGSATNNCNFGPAGAIGCGAPNGLYRISEYDCLATAGQTAQDGTGGPNDGVYMRATFNRTLLGTGENIMASLEYVAAAMDPAPAAPQTCFVNGVPAPEQCSNVTWKAYIKHSGGEMVQPFLMLVPPTQNFVNIGLGTSGVSSQMRQFIIPLAGDPQLSVLQISRVHSNLDVSSSATQTACDYNGGSGVGTTLPANSPLCAGLVIYSLTLYRI